MAYVSGDMIVTVRGMIGPSEEWNNVWSFTPDAGTPDSAAVITALHDFYDNLKTLFDSNWTSTNASIYVPLLGATFPTTWPVITGTNTNEMLPSQLAIRISLGNLLGVNGGPFLPAPSRQVAGEFGLIDSTFRDTIGTQLDTLNDGVRLADYFIGIHRPTLSVVAQATRARVGERFDVIRRRSNDTPEAYVLTQLG